VLPDFSERKLKRYACFGSSLICEMNPELNEPNLPPRPLLFYDGLCAFCAGVVQWVLGNEKAPGRVHFCSIQSPLGQRIYRAHGLDPEQPHTLLLLTESGGSLMKSDAVFELMKEMRGSYAWLRCLRFIPRGVRDIGYAVVARFRYRLFGKHETCWIPQPEWRPRFHDDAA
jgi:predicted DCC family thiol-disulfide oxidoreductase YuxK